MQEIVKQKLKETKEEILKDIFYDNDSLHYDLLELSRLEKMLGELITDKTAKLVFEDFLAINNTCLEEKIDLAYKAGINVALQLIGTK